MSSHHVIREGQEPALLINEIPNGKAHQVFFDLLEWSPLLGAGSPSILRQLVDSGIQVDWLLCKEEEVATASEWLSNRFPLKVIKGKNPEEQVSHYYRALAQQQATGLHIFGPPHLFSAGQLATFPENFALVFFYRDQKHYWLASGSFQKWYPQGQMLHIENSFGAPVEIKMGKTVQHIVSCQMRCPGDGIVRMRSSKPFWLVEDLS